MKVRYLVVAASIGALGAFTVSSAIGAKRPVFPGVLFATATGKKEVSPTTGKKGAGDKNARAGFTAVFDDGQVCWGIAAKNVDGTPSGAHIHKGGANVNGPIVVGLTPPENADPGASSGCQAIEEKLAKDIKQHPNRYYFNLHSTPKFPAGAARGQLSWKTK
ncbi:MAG: CHRD domain-containing protein [Solirubrobacteraceae bacterium]